MTVNEWLGTDNDLNISIWKKKYQYKDETFDQWLNRISNGNEALKKLILAKKFLPGGRILANRGLPNLGVKTSYSNCYVLSVKDSIEGIYKTCAEMARTYSYGGGVGIDISNLRPKGGRVHNSAEYTTGAVSFMSTFDLVTQTIGMKGRRGALMISMSIEHPDIEDFIDSKANTDKITSANISVRMSDTFMKALENNDTYYIHRWPVEPDHKFTSYEIQAVSEAAVGELISITEGKDVIYLKKSITKDLFMKIAKNNWDYGEPGILYWDTINKGHLMAKDTTFTYAGVNPCFTGDMELYVVENTEDGKLINRWVTFKELSTWKDVIVIKPNGSMSPKNKVWSSGIKDVLELTFSNGTHIRCTPDHKFLLYSKTGEEIFEEAQNLIMKDCVLINIQNNEFGEPVINRGPQECIKVINIVRLGKQEVYDFSEGEDHMGIVRGIVVHNCAEEPLPNYGACLLGSINLAAYDNPLSSATFDKDVQTATKALIEIQKEGIPFHPLYGQRKIATVYKQIGLGIMGLADLLIGMKLTYGSKEALIYSSNIMQKILINAFMASCDVNSNGEVTYPHLFESDLYKYKILPYLPSEYKYKYPYNSQLLTIAPTGTLSTLLGVSGGAEPIFAMSYTRTTKSLYDKDKVYEVFHKKAQDWFKDNNLEPDLNLLPSYFVSSGDIPIYQRLDMQSVLQQYIDASISSTINLPQSATIEDIYQIYINAWKKGLKGVTVFRSGCKRAPILATTTSSNTPEFPLTTAPKRPKVLNSILYKTGAKGEFFFIFVGLLCNRPYEIFAISVTKEQYDQIDKKTEGTIEKVKKRVYKFKSTDGKIIFDNIALSGDQHPFEHNTTLHISSMLRHGMPIEQIMKVEDKCNNIVGSFNKAIWRILAQYTNVQDTEELCPECKEGHIIMENGCKHCNNCGYSICMILKSKRKKHGIN